MAHFNICQKMTWLFKNTSFKIWLINLVQTFFFANFEQWKIINVKCRNEFKLLLFKNHASFLIHQTNSMIKIKSFFAIKPFLKVALPHAIYTCKQYNMLCISPCKLCVKMFVWRGSKSDSLISTQRTRIT